MSDKKYLSRLILAGLLLAFFASAFYLFSGKEKKSFRGNKIKEFRIGENIFQAEIVSTSAKRNLGLSNRKDLCESCAMLFLLENRGLHSFWMKGMEFDLDMLWIDENAVVFMAKNVSREKELERIKPDRAADKVLEINAGLADKLGIKIGDKVEF